MSTDPLSRLSQVRKLASSRSIAAYVPYHPPSSPVQNLFGKIGLNMTDVVKRGSTLPWDPRIPLITDDNYDEMIVNEVMTEEEEKDRAWFLIMYVLTSLLTVLC